MVFGSPDGRLYRPLSAHWSSRLLQAVSLIGVSLPTFLVGILLILFFAVILHWLPSFGRGETVTIGWWTTNFLTVKGLEALILPSITLGLFQLTLIMRLVRSEMLEVMRTDYIKFARARGLTNRAINFGHALKNTLVPVITVAGLQLGALIAFALVTETVFAWPGVGQLFIQSVQFSDIPVMAAYLMLIGLLFVIINLVVDLLYFAVDPRLRGQAARRVWAGTDMADWIRRAADSDIWWSFKILDPDRRRGSGDLLIILIALLSPVLAPHTPFDPATLNLSDGLKPPVFVGSDGDWTFPLGTDDQGRDVLSSIMYGTRLSLVVGFASVVVAMVLGIALGLISGYVGGASMR
jgi:ABC-type dipeptide/oligopeptide/nickel transport system permease component